MVEIFFCSSRILQNVSRSLYSEFADAGSVPGISGESEIHLSSPQNEDFVRCFLTFDGDDDDDVKIRKGIGFCQMLSYFESKQLPPLCHFRR